MIKQTAAVKGWALVNFPRNMHQAQLLQASGNIPQRVIFVEDDDDWCRKNLREKE